MSWKRSSSKNTRKADGSGSVQSGYYFRFDGGGHWTVPELSFEKKQLILALHHLLITDRTRPVD